MFTKHLLTAATLLAAGLITPTTASAARDHDDERHARHPRAAHIIATTQKPRHARPGLYINNGNGTHTRLVSRSATTATEPVHISRQRQINSYHRAHNKPVIIANTKDSRTNANIRHRDDDRPKHKKHKKKYRNKHADKHSKKHTKKQAKKHEKKHSKNHDKKHVKKHNRHSDRDDRKIVFRTSSHNPYHHNRYYSSHRSHYRPVTVFSYPNTTTYYSRHSRHGYGYGHGHSHRSHHYYRHRSHCSYDSGVSFHIRF